MALQILRKKYLYQRKTSVPLCENAQRQKKKLFYNLKDNFLSWTEKSVHIFCMLFFRYFNIQKIKLKIYDIKIFRI